MHCTKCNEEEGLILCPKCQGTLCLRCAKADFDDDSHLQESHYYCQEC